ncbi:uncharacterized protein LOC119459595 [Dermacentor silvarum]|uniref:uncharacterized protein LOC119459595 n=1 Tax=Dermacentor silvarum TaxID=543639 RepID=UPI002101AF88|nr:uncharacterized protein LOC119459595 [Dermacentor silvarum]
MQMLRIAAVILFVLKHISANSTANEAEKYDIIKFLNTTEKIWLYNTSATTRLFCRFDSNFQMNDTAVSFDKFYWHKKWAKKRFVGVLRSWDSAYKTGRLYDSMDVLTTDRRHKWVEILVYQNTESTCAVFRLMYTKDGKIKFSTELRVKNSAIDSGPDQNCSTEFQSYLEGRTPKQVYHPKCKNDTDLIGDAY